jgi:hypothetical protein
MKTSRRDLFKSAVGLALASKAAAGKTMDPLPTVRFGNVEITRLVCGANPFYGYSHFNTLFSRHMKEWMNSERIIQTLRQCEANGINTWQLHYSEQSVADLKLYRESGGKMNIFFLSMNPMHDDLKKLAEVAALKPVGIAHHGGISDNCYRDGKMDQVREFLKAVRDTGVMVGLSAHNPRVIEHVEEKGWDIDYYMTCFYRVSRTPEEARKDFGESPVGEIYMEKDPERMTAVVRQVRKPCFGFKILAAGRKANRPQEVASAFDYAFANIKPTDGVIVGLYPRYNDQARENAEHVRRIHRRSS